MPSDYNLCLPSSLLLFHISTTKEKNICKNHILNKRCKSYYYICLGALVNTIRMQIENKSMQNDYLHLNYSRYTNDLYKLIHRYKSRELFTNDFFKSFVTSVVLFAVGIKIANELSAWRIL
ncbi:unnamed protein product [Xylocopa violacea]|uniref:Uncharacterized protein n=1 Tax=Xylocopa violacea TaxID=135666 RepID=A0ABP1P7Z9_XYLVO